MCISGLLCTITSPIFIQRLSELYGILLNCKFFTLEFRELTCHTVIVWLETSINCFASIKYFTVCFKSKTSKYIFEWGTYFLYKIIWPDWSSMDTSANFYLYTRKIRKIRSITRIEGFFNGMKWNLKMLLSKFVLLYQWTWKSKLASTQNISSNIFCFLTFIFERGKRGISVFLGKYPYNKYFKLKRQVITI